MRAFTLVLACLVGLFQLLTGGSAEAAGPAIVDQRIVERRASSPVLEQPARRARKVLFTGRAQPRARVVLQVRDARWRTVRKTRAAKRTGRYRLAVRYPRTAERYRVVSGGRASKPRRVVPPAPAPAPAPTPAPVPEPDPVVEQVPAPVDACGSQPKRADGSYYECSFVDEFDGERLDTNKWLVQETWYSGMTTGNNDCYVNDDQTIAVREGALRLTSQMRPQSFTCQSPYGDFTTSSTAATVSTRGKKFRYVPWSGGELRYGEAA